MSLWSVVIDGVMFTEDSDNPGHPTISVSNVLKTAQEITDAINKWHASGLDEFHPDTTHNPIPTAPVDLSPAG